MATSDEVSQPTITAPAVKILEHISSCGPIHQQLTAHPYPVVGEVSVGVRPVSKDESKVFSIDE